MDGHLELKCHIFLRSPTPLEIPIKLHTNFWALQNPPSHTPQEISIPSVGGVWIFSGTAQCLSHENLIDV